MASDTDKRLSALSQVARLLQVQDALQRCEQIPAHAGAAAPSTCSFELSVEYYGEGTRDGAGVRFDADTAATCQQRNRGARLDAMR